MRKLIIVSVIIFNSAIGFTQPQKAQFVAEIFFGAGFSNGNRPDSIDFWINNKLLYDDYGIYSVPSTALANGGVKLIKINREICSVNAQNQVVYIGRERKHTRLKLYFNDNSFDEEIDFNLGKYVVLEIRNDTLEIAQFEKMPSFY
jgi:hypothetical protein